MGHQASGIINLPSRPNEASGVRAVSSDEIGKPLWVARDSFPHLDSASSSIKWEYSCCYC